MIRLFILFIFITLSSALSAGDNAFKQAKTAMKKKSGLIEAESALLQLARSRETAHADRAKAYNMAALLAQRINETENVKLYLKQPFDTVSFFNSIERLYQHTLSCDSIEREADERGRLRTLYAKENRALRLKHRKNLLEGGKWMMQKQRYAEAYTMFDTYCQADSQLLAADTTRLRIAYWATTCAYSAGDMPAMLRYVDTALQTKYDLPHLLEYKSRAQLALGDTLGWEKTLEQGQHDHPSYAYFYVVMNTHLRQHRRFNEALFWTERLMRECPDSTVYRYGQVLTFNEMEEPDSCIKACDNLLARTQDYPLTYFYKGRSWVLKAEEFSKEACFDLNNPKCREDRKQLQAMYREALLPLETYRLSCPDDGKAWAPILYKVYYALNMGAELDQVEQIIKAQAND